MLIPEILPDEFAAGYLGRIATINGYPNREWTLRAIDRRVGSTGRSGPRPPAVVLLAAATAQKPTEFVLNHSLVPFFAGVRNSADVYLHGLPSEPDRLHKLGMKLGAEWASFCEHCVSEDLQFWGFSFWRRSHQIPGIETCSKHSAMLHIVKALDLASNPAVPCAGARAQQRLAIDSDIVNRYSEISIGLLDNPQPLGKAHVTRRLEARARIKGIRHSPGRRPLLSDLAKAKLPPCWLLENFPQITNKSPDGFLYSFDCACTSNGALVSTSSYALAAALLYESADDALRDLFDLVKDTKPRSQRSTLLLSDNGRLKTLVQTYIDSQGIYSAAARKLDLDVGYMRDLCTAAGLPSLHRISDDIFSALKAFFSGRTLDQVCKDYDITLTELQPFLRASGEPFRRALQSISTLPTQSPASKH